jgi:hypothetical protein
VNDPALIRRMLIETADYLDTIVERTLAALEDGSPPHVDIVRRVEIPESDSPWLQPVYDEAEFIVRNVIRDYGGWWSGRPSDLKPAPRAEVARGRWRGGRPRPACHLADLRLRRPRRCRAGRRRDHERRAGGDDPMATNSSTRRPPTPALGGLSRSDRPGPEPRIR